jgi:hypothetical protein
MDVDYLQQTMQTMTKEPTNRLAVNPAHLNANIINEMIDIPGERRRATYTYKRMD